MEKDRNNLVLYTTAVCNLKCRYCYIDKNPALVTIDNILDESFKGDYYFNFAKELFLKDCLTTVQIWGGEPSLRLDRAYYTIEKLIEYYPNLSNFMTSTNFTYSKWDEQFYGLLKVLGKFPNRHFHFQLQLSIDGPKYINDNGRGEGVTDLFIKNFDNMIDTIDDNLPKNVDLVWMFKPTLDTSTIRLLDTKEKIIEYYQFFETFYDKMQFKKNLKNFGFDPSIPNTACPSPHTKEDGILFAKFCKMCKEIETENRKTHKYFKYYQGIIPYRSRKVPDKVSYNCAGGTCGTGKNVVGLLPNHMISACHNGFVDLVSDYKNASANNKDSSLDFTFFAKNRQTKMTMTVDEFKNYEKQIEYYYLPGTKARLANIASLINLLARVGQVDEKYQDRKEALRAAHFMQYCAAYCIRDNYNSTGSISLYPVGLLKLLLNGAREYCEEDV